MTDSLVNRSKTIINEFIFYSYIFFINMNFYIILKELSTNQERFQSNKLLHQSIMAYCMSAFIMFLFKEITFQCLVLLAAVLFIFVGLPVTWCLITIPIITVMVYFCTYLTHYHKASEKTELRSAKTWIAVAYEPYFLMADTTKIKYTIVCENQAEDEHLDWKKLKSKIIGTVSIRSFHGPNNSMWLYGLAVDPGYQRKGVARALLECVVAYCRKNEIESIELVTSDLQNEARILFQAEGFILRQLYHKQLLGTMLTMPMCQLSLALNADSAWTSDKTQ